MISLVEAEAFEKRTNHTKLILHDFGGVPTYVISLRVRCGHYEAPPLKISFKIDPFSPLAHFEYPVSLDNSHEGTEVIIIMDVSSKLLVGGDCYAC